MMKPIFLRALCLLCAVMLLGTLALTGCGSEAQQPATETDPHAGHNHGDGTTADTDTHDTADTHDHDAPSNMSISYKDNDDSSVSIVIKDCKGNELFSEKVLNKTPLCEYPAEGVICLSWVTDEGSPEGYECLYVDRLTCRVSGIIKGVQAHDNRRIVYTEIADGKLNILVRDLFDRAGYSRVIQVADAYLDGAFVVKGVYQMDEDTYRVNYNTNNEGAWQGAVVDLYEKDEQKPATDATKTTEKN